MTISCRSQPPQAVPGPPWHVACSSGWALTLAPGWGVVARYLTEPAVDGLPPGEGAFVACTSWLADNLAMLGRQADARRLFERLLALRNDVGLLSEQYDPVARRLMGNFSGFAAAPSWGRPPPG